MIRCSSRRLRHTNRRRIIALRPGVRAGDGEEQTHYLRRWVATAAGRPDCRRRSLTRGAHPAICAQRAKLDFRLARKCLKKTGRNGLTRRVPGCVSAPRLPSPPDVLEHAAREGLMNRHRTAQVSLLVLSALSLPAFADDDAKTSVFTQAQAQRGKVAVESSCGMWRRTSRERWKRSGRRKSTRPLFSK